MPTADAIVSKQLTIAQRISDVARLDANEELYLDAIDSLDSAEREITSKLSEFMGREDVRNAISEIDQQRKEYIKLAMDKRRSR